MNFAPWQDLAAAVVARAADDYRTIKKGGHVKGASEKEIVRFFKSDYCQVLCGAVSAKMIWERINDELKESV